MGLHYGKGGMLYACFNVVIFIVIKFVIFAAAIFVSNIVQSLTGFAGVMLSIPPSMLLFGPDMAIDIKLYSLVSPQIIGPVYGRASRTSSRRQKECGRCRW